MYSVSRVHGASGRQWLLEPAVAADEALEDLRRRVAHVMGVGALQVRLLCGARELQGDCAVSQLLAEEEKEERKKPFFVCVRLRYTYASEIPLNVQ